MLAQGNAEKAEPTDSLAVEIVKTTLHLSLLDMQTQTQYRL
jgi:hypothetical protein